MANHSQNWYIGQPDSIMLDSQNLATSITVTL